MQGEIQNEIAKPEQGLGVHMKLSECKLSYYLCTVSWQFKDK